jgi:hypothetical protein
LVLDRLDSWVVDRTIEKESLEAMFDFKFKKIVVQEKEEKIKIKSR